MCRVRPPLCLQKCVGGLLVGCVTSTLNDDDQQLWLRVAGPLLDALACPALHCAVAACPLCAACRCRWARPAFPLGVVLTPYCEGLDWFGVSGSRGCEGMQGPHHRLLGRWLCEPAAQVCRCDTRHGYVCGRWLLLLSCTGGLSGGSDALHLVCYDASYAY